MEKENTYDSTRDTLDHILRVQELMNIVIGKLAERARVHDQSKLSSPEKELFDKWTPILKNLIYGTTEYNESLNNLRVAIDHHYKHNTHHPEYYENGINDFDLFDLIECFVDWKAAGERNTDGNIFKSIDINMERFGISDQLVKILKNTAKRLNF